MNRRQSVEELDKKYLDRKVVLVNEEDIEIGSCGLVEAHRDNGRKHRAFSLQLYRKTEHGVELLLQQRAESKPVFPLYWANTCCYNMAVGEIYLSRAVSRVKEELGVVVEEKNLRELYKFSYAAEDLEGWCENEIDNVIVGEWDGEIKINDEETKETRWVEWGKIDQEIAENPESFAPWFKLIVRDSRFRSVFE